MIQRLVHVGCSKLCHPSPRGGSRRNKITMAILWFSSIFQRPYSGNLASKLPTVLPQQGGIVGVTDNQFHSGMVLPKGRVLHVVRVRHNANIYTTYFSVMACTYPSFSERPGRVAHGSSRCAPGAHLEEPAWPALRAHYLTLAQSVPQSGRKPPSLKSRSWRASAVHTRAGPRAATKTARRQLTSVVHAVQNILRGYFYPIPSR